MHRGLARAGVYSVAVLRVLLVIILKPRFRGAGPACSVPYVSHVRVCLFFSSVKFADCGNP